MRFTLIKDIKQDKMMSPILSGLLIFTILYLISDILVKYYGFGIFPSDVYLTLFGNEEEFIDPITKSSFLEIWHMEIFFIMMILLSLSAVFIRLCKSNFINILILNIVLLSSIISIISLVLSFFISDSFILSYVFCFFIWHIGALYMAIYSLWNLYHDTSL